MKPIILLIVSTIAAYSQATFWQTRMIQSQVEGAVGIPEIVANNGERPSLPIGAKGSRFDLWGIKITNGAIARQEMLDSTEVGVYLPKAEITIKSNDPHTGFYRSRVDQPFSVSYKISNLLPASRAVPEAAQKVLVEHYADLYKSESYDGTVIESSKLVRSFYLETNATHTFSFPVTNISAPDIVRRSGKERFVVYALADSTVPKREIAKAEIVMYPVPEGILSGIDESMTYRSLPTFNASLWRVYPKTSTWVEIYDGAYSAEKRGNALSSTFETPGHLVPETFAMLEFSTFPTSLQPTTKGWKTFVLRASSPFANESIAEGGRVLAHKTISVGAILSVNAMLTTIE
jgi:hypothetical protein